MSKCPKCQHDTVSRLSPRDKLVAAAVYAVLAEQDEGVTYNPDPARVPDAICTRCYFYGSSSDMSGDSDAVISR